MRPSIAKTYRVRYDRNHNEDGAGIVPYDLGHTAFREMGYIVSNVIFKEAAMISEKKKVTKDTIIGDVIKNIPGGRAVIEKYFGNGCFTCPGINMESLSFGSMMHNLDPDKIVNEINNLEG